MPLAPAILNELQNIETGALVLAQELNIISALSSLIGVKRQQQMLEITKSDRKGLRRWANIAYDRELGAELAKLGAAIETWRIGKCSPHAVSDEIHQFHDGVARDLFRFYTRASPESAVAQAVVSGVIAESELPPELLAALAPLIQFRRWEESARVTGEADGDADRDAPSES